MKVRCGGCGRESEVGVEEAVGSCASCGGKLERVGESGAEDGTLEFAELGMQEGMTCPNCGKWIEAGAQICTACGYSRRLGRTLTTRVGTPEMMKAKQKGEPEAPEIDAEKSFRRAKARERGARGDSLRLVVAVMWLLVLGAIVMGAPTGWFGLVPLKLPGLLQPPKFDTLNASFMMLMFLLVAVPITAIGVGIAAAVTGIEISTYFSWVRTAGVLAAVAVVVEIVFTLDQMIWHLDGRLLIAALAAAGALTLVAFTWYLHNVNFSGAIVLSLATLISAAVGLFAAAAAFGWVGHFLGIGPVIGPVNTWRWPRGGA